MPANVGQMFYYGETPWHREGVKVGRPLTVDEALDAGGLEWSVGTEPITTAHTNLGTDKRRALVRWERGEPVAVVGVVHDGFRPLQNRDGAETFDGIFGHGQPIYHTGGYLGQGEVVWLQAALPQTIHLGDDDPVECYALYANSHDGSRAITMALTTVRVVCQNTLKMALHERGTANYRFSQRHQISPGRLAEQATDYWQAMLDAIERTRHAYQKLAMVECHRDAFAALLDHVVPPPRKPAAGASQASLTRYQRRLAEVHDVRSRIERLREGGRGADLPSAQGTLWGALNAFTEYYDHHAELEGSRLAYGLLGQGAALKQKAFEKTMELAK